MGLLELLLVGIGLSMDAFAVSICQGLCMPKLNWRHAAVIALFFGGFQALMPLAGWFLGSRFAGYIQNFDHWVAFVLLVIIGGNMLREAFGPEDDEDEAACAVDAKLDLKQLFLMAVATSIDALAVGVTFAFLEVKIVPAISIIGTTTFCLSLVGVAVGNFFGTRYKKRAEAAGGIILILLGIKILLEHLGIL
ncbi:MULTISPECIES: manganese efflux pump MntP family protein [environmental samples]|jgi:putative Mn2+ efflux pump MntP|uniref:manganese efflux pump MntP n=1 Tax=environmental samples TaxID=876090 RepID=UPI00033A53E4|nr:MULTISPECIES: manganese efflux pump MntP family protein [environmental samples]CDC72899.1 putative manganese efflux pump MntP [Oscillibacter sp. CAG:155]